MILALTFNYFYPRMQKFLNNILRVTNKTFFGFNYFYFYKPTLLQWFVMLSNYCLSLFIIFQVQQRNVIPSHKCHPFHGVGRQEGFQPYGYLIKFFIKNSIRICINFFVIFAIDTVTSNICIDCFLYHLYIASIIILAPHTFTLYIIIVKNTIISRNGVRFRKIGIITPNKTGRHMKLSLQDRDSCSGSTPKYCKSGFIFLLKSLMMGLKYSHKESTSLFSSNYTG